VAGTYFGFQRTLQTLRRRAIGIGLAIMAIGALLYFTLADPDNARRVTPSFIDFENVHLILLALIVVLTLMFIQNARELTSR
jgi:hypothetical protein